MRFVFLDEGGISQHEPFVVVAGVIVHGDEQLIPLEKKLDRLIRKHIPEEQQPGFVFHATSGRVAAFSPSFGYDTNGDKFNTPRSARTPIRKSTDPAVMTNLANSKDLFMQRLPFTLSVFANIA